MSQLIHNLTTWAEATAAVMWVVAVTQAALKVRRLQTRCNEMRDRLEELKR